MNVGRNQIPERKSPIDGVKMKKILSLSLDKNEVDRIASVMEMKEEMKPHEEPNSNLN
jgi:hypothetical protein